MGNVLPSTEPQKSAIHENKIEQISYCSEPLAVEFKVHIAIDFGTNGCGLAFAYKNKVTVYDKWKSRNFKRKNKTKTQILLNDKNECVNFGDEAKRIYCGLEGGEETKWKLFERFKMALYEKDLSQSNIIENMEQKNNNKVDTDNLLTATNGAKCEAEVVFVEAFKRLQKLAKQYLTKINITKEKIRDSEIQWILTVPAIWSEKAKHKMRRWIIKAGLVNKNIIHQCIIVLEPDCAALSIQKMSQYINMQAIDEMNSKQQPTLSPKCKFEKGDKYILIDAGGGTVDIACHEVFDDGVEEILYPTGDKWGSCYIDDDFTKLLGEIFSEEWIDYYKTHEPAGFVEIVTHFQQSKSTFYENSEAITHSIQLPFEFAQYLEEKCNSIDTTPNDQIDRFADSNTLQFYTKLFDTAYVDKTDEKDEKCTLKLVQKSISSAAKNDEEYLEIDIKIWKCLFDSKINKIILHIGNLLKMQHIEHCKYLCLVGGFSSSLYFQHKIIEYFGPNSGYQLQIIIPERPILSVVEGAAWMGITKDYIKARRPPKTYGIRMCFSKSMAKDYGISNDYIKENTTYDGRVGDCFKIIVQKNERIALKQTKITQSHKRGKVSLIPILWSDKEDPKVANDGKEEALLKVQHKDDVNGEIMTEFHFYDTMFKVESYPKNDPNAKESVEINYELT